MLCFVRFGGLVVVMGLLYGGLRLRVLLVLILV